MISVIIPSYRNPEYLELCLESAIKLQREKHQNEFIVVVDGFTDMYQQLIRNFPQVVWISFTENQGLAFALNTGVQYANNKHVLILNEDNISPIGWDVVCEDIYDDNTVVSFMQVEPQQSIFHFKCQDFGTTPKNFNMEGFLTWEQRERKLPILSDKGCLFPFLINKEKYMMVGGFDTSYSSPFVVDLDFWYKLQLAKLYFKTSSRMTVYHFGSRSTKKRNGDTTDWNATERFGMEQFQAKWGFVPSRDNLYRITPLYGSSMRGI